MNRSLEIGIQTANGLSPWDETTEMNRGYLMQFTPKQKTTKGKVSYYSFNFRESPCRHEDKIVRTSIEAPNRASLTISHASVNFPEQSKFEPMRIHRLVTRSQSKRGQSEPAKGNLGSRRPPTANVVELKPFSPNKILDQLLPSANQSENLSSAPSSTTANFNKTRRKFGAFALPRVMKGTEGKKASRKLEDFAFLNCVKINPSVKRSPKGVQTIDAMTQQDYSTIEAPENYPYHDDRSVKRENNQLAEIKNTLNMTRLMTAAQESIDYYGSYEEDSELNNFMGSEQYYEELHQNITKILRGGHDGEIKRSQDFPLPTNVKKRENVFERNIINFKKQGPPSYGVLLRRYKAATRPFKINSRPATRENDVVLRQQLEMLTVKAAATGQPIYQSPQNRTKTK